MSIRNASYERPVRATLHVHLDNGESWVAKPEDLERFGVGNLLDAYMRFDDTLTGVLRRADLIEGDITTSELNAVRYLVEIAIGHPDLLDHADHDGWSAVADLERILQAQRGGAV